LQTVSAILDLTGSCLCGGVRFSYRGPLGGELGAVTVCHCSQCRRAQGFAAAVAPARTEGFTLIAGGNLISEYQSSPGKFRAFCGVCGSPLYSRTTAKPAALRLRLGALDATPAGLEIEAHIHAEDGPGWIFPDAAPRYPGQEPGRP
jgi:hypothetical protein